MEVDVKVTGHPNVLESDKERDLVIDLNNTEDNMKMVECDSMIDPNGVKENVSEAMQELALDLSGSG